MHRLSRLRAAKLGRSFSVSRISRNTEASISVPQPPPSTGVTYGRKLKRLAGVNLHKEPKEVPKALIALEESIQALEAVADVEEVAAVEEVVYSEQDLALFYQDVLANPFEEENTQLRVDEETLRKARAAEDAALVESMYERFDVDQDASTSKRPYLTILTRLESIIARLEATERICGTETQNFPIAILSPRECEALVRVSIASKDVQSAELILELMKKTGLDVPEESVTDLLQVYARLGDMQAADRILENRDVTEDQRHLHLKVYLKAEANAPVPVASLRLLHKYETNAVPAPMKTYGAVISTLFSRPSSISRSQGWDLFSHMRYVAHPDPDVVLYTTMIRACASPLSSSSRSEVQKALDLWTEMTVDHRLTPTVAAYNAVILACSRSGTKEFVAEAFRIARQMLDSHRDAYGVSAYQPDRKTFAALLEGAKRIGDLARVRWILAEMTRGGAGVDEETMLHTFNAYAAYQPPFHRAATKVVSENDPAAPAVESTPTSAPESSTESEASSSSEKNIVQDHDAPSFAHIPPQTHGEVIQEAEFLFRCIREAGSQDAALASDETFAKFRDVHLTPRLVTAYMSIFYNHASLYRCRELFNSIYAELGVRRPIRAYVEALERCANSKKNTDGGAERAFALSFAEELWKEWELIEASGEYAGRPLDGRIIERANVAMVRIRTLNKKIDGALKLVHGFVEKYPPTKLRGAPPKPFMRSTRTVLEAARPLVRMTNAVEVPDDFVPPMLVWKDVELLHHRLVAYNRVKDINFLKWVVKAYEWHLRVRRDEATRSLAPRADDSATSPVLAQSTN